LSTANTLTLIVPEVSSPVDGSVDDASRRWPALALLGSRGVLTREPPLPERSPLERWQIALLTTLGIPVDPRRHAAGPLSRFGVAEDVHGFWMVAEPVHLVAGLTDLRLARLRDAAVLRDDERVPLLGALREHFAVHGFAIESSADGFQVGCDHALDVELVCTEAAARTDLATAMPRGHDAAPLRRLMTEVQMVLHTHAVNAARERQNVPAINSLWLFGGGVLDTRQTPPLATRVIADAPYARGVARLHGRSSERLLPPGEVLARAAEGDCVIVIDEDDVDALEARWIAPFLTALGESFARLEIVIGEWRIAATRSDIRKFWRRSTAPLAWLA
jgi:hypothetical protein